jgi:DtxR family Mn-dependent transcriptional regulator
MASLTIENYVKAIYKLTRGDSRTAPTGRLAEELQVSPGTVTTMLKALQDSGFAHYTPYEGVQLTEAGQSLALRVLRRHRLIELFLVHTLDLSWDEVHEEAENMEHAVSDLLIDKIDEYLSFPDVDPHGDPIPRSDGTMSTPKSVSLTSLDIGNSFRIVRVMEQSTHFLRFLTDHGIGIDSVGHIQQKSTSAGVMQVVWSEGETVLSLEVAEKIRVVSEVSP